MASGPGSGVAGAWRSMRAQAAGLRETAHRPFPLPRLPWVLGQTWQDLLFAHWELDPRALRGLLPAGVELDLRDGRAWLGVTPFVLTDFRVRGGAPLPWLSRFLELNVRTYVTVGGDPGIWFLTLEAQRAAAVLGARLGFGLPYRHARMTRRRSGGWTELDSERGPLRVAARYRPVSGHERPVPGSLEAWLTERYRAYTAPGGRVLAVDIHHVPWVVAPAEGTVRVEGMGEALGAEPPDAAPLLHHAVRQDVATWPPRPS